MGLWSQQLFTIMASWDGEQCGLCDEGKGAVLSILTDREVGLCAIAESQFAYL